MVVNEHPPVAIAPLKTAASRTQQGEQGARNGTRVRRIRLVEDGEDVTIPPLSPGRRPPAMAGGILRPLPARGSVRGLFLAKPAHVEREAGKPRAAVL